MKDDEVDQVMEWFAHPIGNGWFLLQVSGIRDEEEAELLFQFLDMAKEVVSATIQGRRRQLGEDECAKPKEPTGSAVAARPAQPDEGGDRDG